MRYIYFSSILASLLLITISTTAQNELYNDGGLIFIEPGALVHVEGEVINTDNGVNAGQIENRGTLQLTGDLTNNGSTFGYTGIGSAGDVKMIGANNTQYISGQFDSISNRFNNLIIDKTSNNVVLNDDIGINGYLVWGSATSTPGYSPTASDYNNGDGIIETGSNVLTVHNGAPGAIVGHTPAGTSTNNRYVQNPSSGVGGISIFIENTGNYILPVGNPDEFYNPIAFSVSTLPTTGYVSATFDQSAAPAITYDYYVGGATSCAVDWFIFHEFQQNHGEWSVSGPGDMEYTVRTYPFTGASTWPGGTGSNTRTIRNAGSGYGTGIAAVGNFPDDLCAYTVFSTSFNGATGVPGGTYTGFGDFRIATDESNALPVELLYLEANAVNNDFIRVDWGTSVEIDNEGFEVYRSEDGQNFSYLGWVDGNGTTSEAQTYMLDDKDVMRNQRYYYQLKQVDNNGEFKWTNIVSAMIIGDDHFSISDFQPNPSTNQSALIINAASDKTLDVSLYNSIGQVIQKFEQPVVAGVSTLQFDLNNVADGTYHAMIIVDGEIYDRKLVITKY